MTRRAVQLRLTRPAKKVRMERLTRRQRALLDLLRAPAEISAAGTVAWRAGVEAARVGQLMGYAHPARACDRLVARGLAMKVRPGIYRARVIRERSL